MTKVGVLVSEWMESLCVSRKGGGRRFGCVEKVISVVSHWESWRKSTTLLVLVLPCIYNKWLKWHNLHEVVRFWYIINIYLVFTMKIKWKINRCHLIVLLFVCVFVVCGCNCCSLEAPPCTGHVRMDTRQWPAYCWNTGQTSPPKTM